MPDRRARCQDTSAADEAALEALSEAIESGAGLPAVARAAAAALGASVALIDRSSAVLAVAAASSAEESKLLSAGDDVGDGSSCGSPTPWSASSAIAAAGERPAGDR